MIITHGRAKRRMIMHAVAVGAAAARVRLPELIGETFRRPGASSLPGAPDPTVDAEGSQARPPAAGTPA